MTFCKVCGKLLPNVRFDPKETVICNKCADSMKEDMVRVVRCKDCKWWHESEINKEFGDCGQANGITLKSSDWFCADGVRKQED